MCRISLSHKNKSLSYGVFLHVAVNSIYSTNSSKNTTHLLFIHNLGTPEIWGPRPLISSDLWTHASVCISLDIYESFQRFGDAHDDRAAGWEIDHGRLGSRCKFFISVHHIVIEP